MPPRETAVARAGPPRSPSRPRGSRAAPDRSRHAAPGGDRRPDRAAPDRQRQRARPARTTSRCSAGSAPTTSPSSTVPPTGPPRRLVEYWAHVASMIPPATHPLLRWRMERWREDAWGSMQRIAVEQPDLVALVLDELRHGGPMTSLEVESALAHDAPRQRDQWGWNWSMVKEALEYLFFSGVVGSAGRTASSSAATTSSSASCRDRSSRRRRRPTTTPSAGSRCRGPGPRGGYRDVPAGLLPAASRRLPAGCRRAGRVRRAAAR